MDLDMHSILRDIQRLDILIRIECQRSHLILNAAQGQRGIIQRHLVRDQRTDARDVDGRLVHGDLVGIQFTILDGNGAVTLQVQLMNSDISSFFDYHIIGIIRTYIQTTAVVHCHLLNFSFCAVIGKKLCFFI